MLGFYCNGDMRLNFFIQKKKLKNIVKIEKENVTKTEKNFSRFQFFFSTFIFFITVRVEYKDGRHF